MLATIIVVATFMYTVEIQPVATGDLQTKPLQETGITTNLARYYGILELLLSKSPALFPWTLFKKTPTYTLNTFSSPQELQQFFKKNNANNFHYYNDYYTGTPMIAMSMEKTDATVSNGGGIPVDFSKTNIQVAGVDEPDIAKTDGTYLYIVANSKIYIIQAYPVMMAKILSTITVDATITLNNIFINGDHLVVFGNSYSNQGTEYSDGNNPNWWAGNPTTVIKLYDISDREKPQLEKDVQIDGEYFDARMIGNYVYVLSTQSTYNLCRTLDKNNVTVHIPEITINGVTKEIPCNQIYYADIPETIDTMTHVLSMNINTNEIAEKSFLLGSGQTMYVSENNVFLITTKSDYIQPLAGENYGRYEQKTIIHKVSVDNGDITYMAQGEVPGQVLNQFSMDEHKGFFRIATTISGYENNRDTSTNNMYVLNENLEIVGKLEGVAPGESIYSVRFMGDRAYMVTFKHVDPLFVIDLQDPSDPHILGKLKIPGYSEYLHPYDETHIIGIGKEVDESIDADKIHTEGAVYYTAIQGVKIAIFDVSDVENPIEQHKEVIGDRGTSSLVTQDHKAFLFDREKGLLVIPITLAERKPGQPKNMDGQFVFQGAYVYTISLEKGFTYRDRITHMNDNELLKSGDTWYWGRSSSEISRSLYIDNVLYTISDSMVKMNDLATLSELNSIALQ